MIRKIVAIIAYVLLFLVATVLFTYFIFPLERLKEFIEHKASSSVKYRLEIESIERDGLGELVLTGVTVGVNKKLFKRKSKKPLKVIQPAVPEKEGEEGKAEVKEEKPDEEFSFIDIDSIRLEFSLLQMLDPRSVNIGISVELLDGVIEDGEIELDRSIGFSSPAIRLPSIEGLTLGDTEFFGVLFSAILPSMKADRVTGVLDTGSILLEPVLPEDDEEEEEEEADEEGGEEKKSDKPRSHYSGSIHIELSDIVAPTPQLVQRTKAGKVQVPLTDLILGSCEFTLKIDRKDRLEEMDKVKTKAKHEKATVVLFEVGQCKGESLDYFVSPNSFILFPPKASFSKARMDLWTKMAFNPDFFDQKRVEEGVVVTKNKELGQGLEFDRKWQRAKDLDGYYWMHCKGTLGRPKCKRGLPKAEKKRKKAHKKMEKKRKAEEKKKKKAAAKKAKAAKKKKDKKKGAGKAAAAKKAAAKDRRKEAARKRADEMRKEREKARDRPTLEELKQPEVVPEEENPPEEEPLDEELPPEELHDVLEQPHDVVSGADSYDIAPHRDAGGEVGQPGEGEMVPFP